MTQYSFPWNDVNGDRLYDAEDFMRFFAAFLKTGVVMSFKDGLKIQSAQNGMNIQVGAGSAVIDGGSYLNDEAIAIQVNVASSIQDRVDSVVLRMDKNARATQLFYKAGDTTVARNDTVYELQLATISVKTNAIQITDADITDMRSDPTVCGWSTPFDNINVDGIVDQYKEIFQQADVQFQDWFQNLKNQLDDNQAANLQNQINNSIHDAGQVSSGTDLNNLIIPGFFEMSGRTPDTELINYPPGVTLNSSGKIYAQLVIFKNASSTMVKQVFYDQTSSDEYTRSFANSSWSSWQKVITADESGKVNVKDLEVTGTVKRPSKKILLSGAYWMQVGQVVTPSKAISDCENGWILHFTSYSSGMTGETKNGNNPYFYVPKEQVNIADVGTMFPLVVQDGTMTLKYLYLQNNKITGNAANESTNSKKYVLQHVLEY